MMIIKIGILKVSRIKLEVGVRTWEHRERMDGTAFTRITLLSRVMVSSRIRYNTRVTWENVGISRFPSRVKIDKCFGPLLQKGEHYCTFRFLFFHHLVAEQIFPYPFLGRNFRNDSLKLQSAACSLCDSGRNDVSKFQVTIRKTGSKIPSSHLYSVLG